MPVAESSTRGKISHPVQPTVTSAPATFGTFGDYRLLSVLGKGGMGTVYKAEHQRLEKTVALKVLPADKVQNADAVSRFEREMKAVGKLPPHPHIVQAHDAREEQGTHFLVLEYVDGCDLNALCSHLAPRDEPSPPAAAPEKLISRSEMATSDACELIRQAALGLQHAHEHGLVHRDIKPSNLFLAVTRNRHGQVASAVVKVLDLGLALLQRSGPDDGLTSTGQIMGTLDYIAPEQIENTHGVDIRADLYSLGCTLYMLLTGSPPFSGPTISTAAKKILAHATLPPPPLRDHRPDAPDALVAILNRLLAKDPAQRFAEPAELAEALVPLCSGHNLLALAASLPTPAETPFEPTAAFTPTHASGDQPAISETLVPPRSHHAPRDVSPRDVPPGEIPSVSDAESQKLISRSEMATSRRRIFLATLSGFVAFLVLAGVIIIRIKHKDGTVTEIKVPEGAEVEVVKNPPTVPENSNPKPQIPNKPETPNPKSEISNLKSSISSPLDLLDPAAIPAEERFPWQPKELVGLIGTHRQRHWGNAVTVAFSPDGKLLASGGFDGIVKVFAVPSMEPLGEVRVAERCWVQTLRFSDSGSNSPKLSRLYFGASGDGGVGYIDIHPEPVAMPNTPPSRLSYNSGRRFKLPGMNTRFVALTSLPEQRKATTPAAPGLLIANNDGVKLLAWNILTAEPTLLWERPVFRTSSGTNTAITDDGHRLAYLSAANTVTVLDLTTVPPREVQTLAVEQPLAVVFTPDGRQLAVGTQNARVLRWSVQGDEFTPLPTIEKSNSHSAFSLAISPDGQRLATAYTAVRVVDISVAPPKPIADLLTFVLPFRSLAFSSDGHHLALANDCGVVQCWDLSQQPPRELGSSGEHHKSLLFPGFDRVFDFARRPVFPPSRVDDGDRPYLDLVTFVQPERHAIWRFDGKFPRFMDFVPKSTFAAVSGASLFTAQDELSITYHDITESGIRTGITLPTARCKVFRISDDGSFVYFLGGELRVLTTATKQFRQWSGISAFCWLQPISEDGRRLVLTPTHGDSALQFWKHDGEHGELLAEVKGTGGVTNLSLSSDRQRLLVARVNGLELYDIRELPPKSLFQESGYGYPGIAFSPDGQHFAYCGQFGRLVIRDTATYKVVREWKLPGDLYRVLYAPDGRHLVTLNGNGTAYILRLAPPPNTATPP